MDRALDDWLKVLPEMKKVGAQWCGPCPLCGGEDRFWIEEGREKPVYVGCRQCIDSRDSNWIKRVSQAAFGKDYTPTLVRSKKGKPVPAAVARNLILRAMSPFERRYMSRRPTLLAFELVADWLPNWIIDHDGLRPFYLEFLNGLLIEAKQKREDR